MSPILWREVFEYSPAGLLEQGLLKSAKMTVKKRIEKTLLVGMTASMIEGMAVK
jgi:hypothetical protein